MLDKFKFSEIIETIKQSEGESYIVTISDYCKDNDIDIDLVPDLLTDNLKHKLTRESVTLRLVDSAVMNVDLSDDVFGMDED